MKLGKLQTISRMQLKLALLTERNFCGILVCPLCMNIIHEIPDMHEALITKGDVSGHPLGYLINDKHNCVLVHHKCHMSIIGHGSEEQYKNCAIQLTNFNIDMSEWFEMMEENFKIVATHAKRRYISTMENL